MQTQATPRQQQNFIEPARYNWRDVRGYPPGRLQNLNQSAVTNVPSARPYLDPSIIRKKIPHTEVAAKKRKDEFLGSVDLQKKAIVDLFPLLKSHGVKDRRRWLISTPPWEVVSWIMKNIGEVAGNDDWEFELKDGILGLKFYHEYSFEYDCYLVAAEPLLKMRETDKPLHDILVRIMACLGKYCDICVLDHYAEVEMFEDELAEADSYIEDSKERAKWVVEGGKLIEYYMTGDPYLYLKMVNRFYSLRRLKEAIKKYQPKDERGEKAVLIMKQAIEVLGAGYRLKDFDRVMEEEDQAVLWEYMRIVWRMDDACPISCSLEYRLQGHYEAEGFKPFYWSQVLTKNGDDRLKPVPTWPHDLCQLFDGLGDLML